MASIEAGGRVTLAGLGEVDVMVMTRPGWVRVGTPAATGARAAATGHGADVAISLEGVVAGPRLLHGRAPAVPATAPVVEEGCPTGVLGLPTLGSRRDPWSLPTCGRGKHGGYKTPTPRPGRPWRAALAAWLQEHVTAHMSGPRRPTAWQWDLAVRLMKVAGIAELAGDAAEAGFTARALRQLPLRDWAVGRRGFVPGVAPRRLGPDTPSGPSARGTRTGRPGGVRAGGFPAPARDVEMAGPPAAEHDPPQAPTRATPGGRQERAHASCASAGPAAAPEVGTAGYTADTGGAPPWPAQDTGAAGAAGRARGLWRSWFRLEVPRRDVPARGLGVTADCTVPPPLRGRGTSGGDEPGADGGRARGRCRAPRRASGSPPPHAVVPFFLRGPRTPQRHAALLSLFDGMGTARVAMDEVLRTLRAPPLVGAFFAEAASDLATAVEAAWRDAPDRGVACLPSVRDFCDLARNWGPGVRRLVSALPPDTLLLVVAGPLCIQLTPAAPCGGRVGVCGRESVAAFAVPLIAAAAAAVRADVVVHEVVETRACRPGVWQSLRRGSMRGSPPPPPSRAAGPSSPLFRPARGTDPGRAARYGRLDGAESAPATVRSRAVAGGRPVGPAYQSAPRFLVASVAGPCGGAPPHVVGAAFGPACRRNCGRGGMRSCRGLSRDPRRKPRCRQRRG